MIRSRKLVAALTCAAVGLAVPAGAAGAASVERQSATAEAAMVDKCSKFKSKKKRRQCRRAQR